MKTNLLLYIIFLFPISISAQNEELTDEVWYLHQVKLNEETFSNPNLSESYSFLWFGGDNIFSEICLTGGVHGDFFIAGNEISFSNIQTFPGDCQDDASILFREAYYQIISGNLPFIYSINYLEENVKETIWTTAEGDELYFTTRPYYVTAPSELTQHNWFLQYAKIDGVIHYTPNNEEVNSVILQIDGYHFSTGVCAPLDGSWGFVPQSHDLYILDLAEGMLECSPYYGNNTFQNLYHGFFWLNRFEKLVYEFTENPDQTESLILSDPIGNQLVYGDLQLNTTQYEFNNYNFYPNPVSTLFTLNVLNPEIDQLEVLDLNGKKVFSQPINLGKNVLNFSQLPQGIYFIHIISKDKIIKTEKIIKK